MNTQANEAQPKKHHVVALPESLERERVVSARQGADLLGVSLAPFRRQHWAGKLPKPIQLSERRIGWRVRDLLAHLKAA